ncbi:MAG: TIGR02302 family protein [Rhodospirillum sp.]|nr:TIGR02302 family protein [Rhodospirillum sp.]MCF8489158.1 TIGR02302 family protein [Rhodospirillum sp.]MCF8499825.1 TIGR02302 family protein [Rhodospirillum sp.]
MAQKTGDHRQRSANTTHPEDPAGSPRPTPAIPVSSVWLATSRLVLLWERLWQAFWILACVLGTALALGFSGLTATLPPWVHLVLLLLLLLATVATLGLGLRQIRWPRREDAWHHLETGEDIQHRPLTAATDHLALGGTDPFGALLWRAHRRTMARSARALRPRWPRSRLTELDPWSLRVLPLLFLAVGLAAGYRDPGERLAAFLSPPILPERMAPVARLWLTPPEYTGQPPIRIDTALAEASAPPREGEPPLRVPEGIPPLRVPEGIPPLRVPEGIPPLRVPEGTTILAMVHGQDLTDAKPATVRLGDRDVPLTPLDENTLRAEGTLTRGGRLTLDLEGETLVDRPLEVVPDAPPTIAFTEDPKGDDRGRTHLSLTLSDDYGLASARVDIRPVTPLPEDQESVLAIALPLRAGAKGPLTARVTPDLAAHRWAGRTVGLFPVAEDVRGTVTQGDPDVFTLPERAFTHPVAKAIIAQRKFFTDNPHYYWRVLRALDGLTLRPGALDGQLSVFLALRTVRFHLARFREDSDVERVRALLWSAALRLEEGSLSRATADLDRLNDRLKEALSGDPSQEDIARLLRETREAMTAMLRALAESLPHLSGQMPPLMTDMAPTLDPGAMDQLLRDMEQMNRLGAKDAVKNMLAQLEQMVDQMRSLRAMDMTPEMAKAMEEMRALSEALTALRQDQATLMEDTFQRDQDRRAEQGNLPFPGDQGANLLGAPLAAPPPMAGGDSEALARQQQALAQRLESLLGELGEKTNQIPRDLGDAALAMGEARAMLKQGDRPGALDAQGRALELLSKGNRSAVRSMMRAMGNPMPMMIPMPGNQPGAQSQPNQDPLGRGNMNNGRVTLPGGTEAQRARDILDELRRRANDPDRVQPERDYLERLIPSY